MKEEGEEREREKETHVLVVFGDGGVVTIEPAEVSWGVSSHLTVHTHQTCRLVQDRWEHLKLRQLCF